MSKPLKTKKDRVPKITEEEYAAYVSALKEGVAQQTERGAENKKPTEERLV